MYVVGCLVGIHFFGSPLPLRRPSCVWDRISVPTQPLGRQRAHGWEVKEFIESEDAQYTTIIEKCKRRGGE